MFEYISTHFEWQVEMGYPLIDVLRTGQRLKEACIKKNIEAKEIKQFLGLAAMQSIYSWFQGKALPSLDNFYALSSYLGTELDSLIVPQGRHQEHEILEERLLFQTGRQFILVFCWKQKRRAVHKIVRDE